MMLSENNAEQVEAEVWTNLCEMVKDGEVFIIRNGVKMSSDTKPELDDEFLKQ